MASLRTPTARTCERCGRRERWTEEGWRIVRDDDGPRTGDVFCLHKWDIDGTFVPVEK